MKQSVLDSIHQLGVAVFHRKRVSYPFDVLVDGIILGPNTYRAFHKMDKTRPGAKMIFENFFMKHKSAIVQGLNSARSEPDLVNLKEFLASRLRKRLKMNIRAEQLTSYNKLHKPIDIALEHFVAMGHDFAPRKKSISPLLFLPLDSQIFASRIVFADNEAKELGIRRSFSFKDIADRTQYFEIQDFLKQKARELRVGDRVFFDLVWGKRYTRSQDKVFVVSE